MKATIFFLVEVKDHYNNYVEFQDGTLFAENNSIDSVEHINRVGKVIGAPKGAIVSPGDMLLFHHNICRATYGVKGKRRFSTFLVTGDVFFIPVTEAFMYMKKGETEWRAVDPFVFVEPIPSETITLPNGFEAEEENHNGMKPLVGRMAFPNQELLSMGVNVGDEIAFLEWSEHEYKINDKIYYKMRTRDVLAVL
jgi:co-chaperonin GroES (HSP10)